MRMMVTPTILADDFHIFRVDWEPTQVRWYLDGYNYFTATNTMNPAGTKWVFDHPFFAVTNEQGAFAIPDLPPGIFVLKAWHEDGGIKSQEIVVPESGDVRVIFEFGKK